MGRQKQFSLLTRILLIVILLGSVISCSSLAGTKGKFSEPTKGKALSIIVRRVSTGGLSTSVMLEVSNPSGGNVVVDPLKVKVIADDGSENETTYSLKRNTAEEIGIAGGSIIEGRLGVTNPNRNQSVQTGAAAFLSSGEGFTINLPGSKSDVDKVQVSLGPNGSAGQEVFAITK